MLQIYATTMLMFLKRKPTLVVTWTSNVLQIATFQTYKKNSKRALSLLVPIKTWLMVFCVVSHTCTPPCRTLMNINGTKKPSSQNKMWTTIGPLQQPQWSFLIFVALQCIHKILPHLHSTNIINYEMGITRLWSTKWFLFFVCKKL